MPNKKTSDREDKISIDEEIRKLVVARLKILSEDTMISIGSEGQFTRDELIDRVETDDDVGKKIAEVHMEWLRSFKDKV